MKLKITVHGVAYEVEVEVLDPGDGFAAPSPLPPAPQRGNAPSPSRPAPAAGGSPDASGASKASGAPAPPPAADAGGGRGSVNSPIAGTVVEIRCAVGDQVAKDQVLLVIDAMKMNTSIASPLAGKVAAVKVAAGDTVRENQPLVEIE